MNALAHTLKLVGDILRLLEDLINANPFDINSYDRCQKAADNGVCVCISDAVGSRDLSWIKPVIWLTLWRMYV